MIKRFLMPIDGSENSSRIQSWVVGLARPLNADVVLMTVVDPEKIHMPQIATPEERAHSRAVGDPTKSSAYVEQGGTSVILSTGNTGLRRQMPEMLGTQLIDSAVEGANQYLAELANELRSEGVEVTTTVEVGDPSTEIVKAAMDVQADVIAMATNRESMLARGILGSVTDRVIHSSMVPVLTIRPDESNGAVPKSPNVVVVPLDGSEHSESVVPFATEIAKAAGAKIVFVRAASAPYYAAVADTGMYYASQITLGTLTDEAHEYLEPFVVATEAKGVQADARSPLGNAAGSIMSVADEYDGTLIVMASRGASGLKRWILGSVADKVVRASGHPVIVVPPKPE